MSIAEKNDVDISKLFFWGTEFVCRTVLGDEIKTFIRLVGDADINRARTIALRRSAELRSKLKSDNTDERMAFLVDKETAERNKLIEIIILLSMREFTQDAIREVSIPYPKEPKSDAPLEEMENYQKKVDDYPKLREVKIQKYLEKRSKDKRKELDKSNDDLLYTTYESAIINELCEREMVRVFRDTCVFLGTHKDPEYKTRFFNSLDEFENLPTETKESFLVAYSKLEIHPEELKKSQEAMV